MSRWCVLLAVALLALSGIAGCGDDDDVVARPAPVEPTRDASGHYCGMILLDHKGPKAQVHLPGEAEPVWFSSVRDAIAFTMLPEEPRNHTAIYVNDMGKAQWDAPEPGTWIDADGAHYVIGSARMGGMGVPEAVPFAARDAAERFVAAHGGRIVALTDVPESYIFAYGDEEEATMPAHGEHQ
ncbi:MAG: nitrous oxide reductase accessory protein NosL [Rhodospirillales bacterium]|nr:nitrous oxide reductase accessory protein NosL [Rhodospirillales bacterium]MDE0379263.1 nitrous oxide reductase accessory protein NosL [Rhodospirillales bacterium]